MVRQNIVVYRNVRGCIALQVKQLVACQNEQVNRTKDDSEYSCIIASLISPLQLSSFLQLTLLHYPYHYAVIIILRGLEKID